MDDRLIQTGFRLYERELTQLDALLESPPAWLRSCAPGKIRDRTDLIRRLIFLAANGVEVGRKATAAETVEAKMPTTPKRGRKATK